MLEQHEVEEILHWVDKKRQTPSLDGSPLPRDQIGYEPASEVDQDIGAGRL